MGMANSSCDMDNSSIKSAMRAIADAEYLLFTAGAGMGVDSGLPDFRGNEGFWKAYPPLAKLSISFSQMANPSWFESDPALAWGFYGHRLNLYRQTVPHEGFAVLKQWAQQKPAFVYTSNVDGQFQRAGMENVCEVHGSIHHLQCTKPCSSAIWSAKHDRRSRCRKFSRAKPIAEMPTLRRSGASQYFDV